MTVLDYAKDERRPPAPCEHCGGHHQHTPPCNPDGSRPGAMSAESKGCGCIAEMNERLAEHNTTLVFTFLLRPNKVCVETTQIETGRGKKKAVRVVANFCPFCGEKYDRSQASGEG